MRNKISSRYLSAFLSVLLWGAGQFFICRQKVKGLLLFLVQILAVSTELASGYWLEYFSGQIDSFSLRIHGGFFTRGIWGLITLGQVEAGKYGDHSTMLLITGIIVILFCLLILVTYIYNIWDAYKSAVQFEETKKYESSGDYFRRVSSKSFAYITLAPVAVFIVFVVVMPIVFAVLTAFTNYNAAHLPPGNLVSWVGFDNFKKLFNVPIWSTTFLAVLRWTVIWAVIATFSTYFLGMFQAILLNSKYTKCRSLFRGIMILPWAIPQLVSLLVFKNFLNGQFGPLSKWLMDIGLADHRIEFLADPLIAKVTIIVVNLWLGFPMFMIMIQGILANIDKALYESAELDGGNGFQIFRHITFPLVFKATAPLVVMNLAANFNGFGIIYFLSEGGPVNVDYQFAGSTDILISWIYKLTLNQKMYDMAAVMNIIIFVFVGVVSVWNFRRTQAYKEV